MKEAIINAHICTAAGRDIPKGVIIWNEQGIISYVGENRCDLINKNVFDAKGAWVIPGLIDAHTHLGIQESGIGEAGNDLCEHVESAVTPGMRAIDGICMEDEAFEDALSGGVTTVMVLPGSSNVLSGVGAVLKTAGKSYSERIVSDTAAMKGALGEMPLEEGRLRNRMPVTRMGSAYLLRKTLIQGRNYLIHKKENKLSEIDLDMEAMRLVLEKKMPLRIHAFRSCDIYTALHIADEFQINITIEHGLEAFRIKHELAKRHISVMFGTALNWKYSYETKESTFSHLSELMDAGVEVSMITDHGCTPVQYLSLCAAMAISEGISREEALKTITINPARVLGLDDRLGSLEVGKEADIGIFRMDPFSAGARAERVYIKGTRMR